MVRFEALLQRDLRLPAQMLAGQGDVGLALARIVLGQRLDRSSFDFEPVSSITMLGQLADGELAGIAEIDRAGDLVAGAPSAG